VCGSRQPAVAELPNRTWDTPELPDCGSLKDFSAERTGSSAREKQDVYAGVPGRGSRIAIETSHAIADVAPELGISETSRGTGCGSGKKHAEDEPPLQLSERVRLREVEREVQELRMKADLLSKAAAYFVAERENAPALTHMYAWLEVSKSGFYEWRRRPESATARGRDSLLGYQNLMAERQD
jgi:transposase